MAEEKPSFSAKNLDGSKPKKRIVRRRTAKAGPALKKEIDRQLVSIYKDRDGRLPNMKEFKIKQGHPLGRFIFGLIVFGGLVAGAAWAGFFLFPNNNKFSEEKIKLEVMGPPALNLGATTTYTISYQNLNNFSLKNAVLNVNYPEGFVFSESSASSSNAGHTEWNIGDVGPGGEGKISVTGRGYGALKQKFSWRVFLNYQPENFNSEMKKVATLDVQIESSPFALFASGPDKATVGDAAEYTFKITNDGDWNPDKLELLPNLPANFFIVSSSPALDKSGKWLISFAPVKTSTTTATATVFTELVFKANGKFSDSGETSLPVKAALYLPLNGTGQKYQIAEASLNTELVKNAINFNLAINGSLSSLSSQPGDILNITLHLQNTSPDDLSHGQIKLILDAPSAKHLSILDWKNIVDQYDGDIKGEQVSDTVRRGTLVWDSSKIKDLAKIKAGQDVNIDLRLPIKGSKDFDLSALNDYKISATAEASFTSKTGSSQTIAGNPMVITLNSDLAFENRDEVSTNAEGQEEHAINWVLNNNFHPLKNLSLSADLYGDISFASVSPTPAGELKYDTAAKHLTWTITDMPESVDVLALPFTVTINKKNPTQNTLVSKVHVQADDTVTGEKLDFMGDEITLGEKPPAQ